MADERILFGKEMVISCCTYIQIRNYDTSLCFPKAKKTIQKQWQTMPWSFLHTGCLILRVTAKTESLFSSRGKTTKKPPILVLSETPAKFQEGTDMRSIIISILLKETVSNLAPRQCEIRTKPNLIKPSESLPKSKKSKTADYVQNAMLWRRSVCSFLHAYCHVDSWYVYRLTRNE